MKKLIDTLFKLLPHICIVLSLIFITFLILDQYNPAIGFVDNDVSNVFLWILCVAAVASSIWTFIKDRQSSAKARTKK